MSDFDSNYRQEHLGAVWAAKQEVGEMQDLISRLTDMADRNIGLVANATGGTNCAAESGRNAFEFSASLKDALDGLMRHTVEIVAELERYGSGF